MKGCRSTGKIGDRGHLTAGKDSNKLEENRIRKAYASRRRSDLYSFFNPGNLFLVQGRERRVLHLLKKYGFVNLEEKKILEVGCGSGFWLREFIKWGANPANLTGIDLLPNRIVHAKQVCPGPVTLICGDAAQLDFPKASFDLVVLSTVFTSILDYEMKQQITREVMRVLKPGGLTFWYDFHVNNPKNPNVRGVGKKEICNLFHGCQIKLWRTTLAPPISRLVAPYSFFLCYLLEKIPFLNTHYIGIFHKA
jgi:ubiquinone/menaquinone biosynthesis C-methylase UbiE